MKILPFQPLAKSFTETKRRSTQQTNIAEYKKQVPVRTVVLVFS